MILQSMKMAWKSIVSNKMRSFLTMLGIIIGVFALVVLVSLVDGATTTVTDSINSLGSNLLSVSIKDNKGKPLRLEEVESFMQHEEIAETAPVTQSMMTLSGTYSEEKGTVYGTSGAYFTIQNLQVEYGRPLKGVDVDNHTSVAVISSEAATDILGRANVVGEKIRLNGMQYEIVGVLKESENMMSTMIMGAYQVYVPYTTMVRTQTGMSSEVTSFYASASDANSMDAAETAMKEMLKERFMQDEEAYSIFNQSSVMSVMDEVTGTLSLLLGGIAAISLLVGGIGIMNIMLVSVTERTREIGIRKAIGAGRGTIMLQFLIEAFMVSLMGCIVGIIFSWIAMQVINAVGDVNYSLSPGVVVLSIIFSLLVGLIFGLYPANKAAKKKPIDALRYTG